MRPLGGSMRTGGSVRMPAAGLNAALVEDLRNATLTARMSIAAVTTGRQLKTPTGTWPEGEQPSVGADRASARQAHVPSISGLNNEQEVLARYMPSPVPMPRVSALDGAPHRMSIAGMEFDRRASDGVGFNERSSELMDDPTCIRALSFVEHAYFQGLVATVILSNMWVLALETDHAAWPWWDLVNGLFLLAYLVEFLLRLLFHGPTQLLWVGKARHWMAYDVLVLACGVLDFGLAMWQRIQSTPVDWSVLRFLMLSRLLRIVRVVRMHTPLYDFVKLLLGMLNTFAWILTIIFLFCFVLAIILTRLIGHGLLVKTTDLVLSEQVRAMFSDIPTSLFTLFQLTTADDWARIAMPVIAVDPLWRLFFIFFITFMSWTMLSLLTAVASETMISASSSKKHEEVLFQEMRRQEFTHFLCTEFLRADVDGNGVLNKDEFKSLMTQPSLKQEMKAHGIHFKDADLMRTWDTFDVDESGELTIEELVQGFSYLQEGLATKHVANVGYSLKRFSVKIDTSMDNLQSGIEKLENQQEEVLARVTRQQEAYQAQWADFIARKHKDLADASVRARRDSVGGSAPDLAAKMTGASSDSGKRRGMFASVGRSTSSIGSHKRP